MALALVGLFIVWAVMLLFGAMEFDRGLLFYFYSGERPDVAAAARWATELGGGPVLLAVTGFGLGFLLVRRDWRGAIQLTGITLTGRLLVELQKDWSARVRPDAIGHLVPVDSLAFPSGHAANATMVWLCLALLLPRSARGRAFAVWAAVWLALAVGLSRVMLGVHWPSDVIGGWAFGLFWSLLLLRLSGHDLGEGPRPTRLKPAPESGTDQPDTADPPHLPNPG